MRIRIFGACVLAGVFFTAAPASAQISQCADTLKFDTRTLSQNLLARLSAVSQMTERTFEETKREGGLDLIDIFSGSFSAARQKSREYTSKLSEEQRLAISSEFVSHTLSPAGARAYAECVRGVTGAPLAAWIENTQVRNPVVVKVRLGDSWMAADVTVTGAGSAVAPVRLEGGGSETSFRFAHTPSEPFSVSVTARNPQTNQTRTVDLEQAGYRSLSVVKRYATDTGMVTCGAGCQGNTAGCPLATPFTFVAPDGDQYEEETLAAHPDQAVILGGPGVRFNNLTAGKAAGVDAEGRLVKLTVTPRNCEGNSAHTQGIVKFPYTIRRFGYSIIEK